MSPTPSFLSSTRLAGYLYNAGNLLLILSAASAQMPVLVVVSSALFFIAGLVYMNDRLRLGHGISAGAALLLAVSVYFDGHSWPALFIVLFHAGGKGFAALSQASFSRFFAGYGPLITRIPVFYAAFMDTNWFLLATSIIWALADICFLFQKKNSATE